MKYRTGYKYQLLEPFSMKVPFVASRLFTAPRGWVAFQENEIRIAPGYAWDGASGPTWDSPNVLVPSLVHDAFYQLLRESDLPDHYRAKADALLRDMMIERGASRIRAWAWYWAVRKFAGPSATSAHPVLEAP